MPTIAVVGAGPLLGLSAAKLFGTQGFDVALISRSRTNLDARVASLAASGVDAWGFVGDVTDPSSLETAFKQFSSQLGAVDVMVYTAVDPTVSSRVVGAVDVTVDNLREQIDVQLYGAVSSAQQVLPPMLARGAGTLLFTSAITAVHPSADFANFGIGGAALRYYAATLHDALAPKGIHAAHISVGVKLDSGPGTSPDDVAKLYWDAYVERSAPERLYHAP